MTRRRAKRRNKKGRFAWFYAYDTYIVQLYCSHSHSVRKDWLYLCAQTIFQLKLIGILDEKSSSWKKRNCEPSCIIRICFLLFIFTCSICWEKNIGHCCVVFFYGRYVNYMCSAAAFRTNHFYRYKKHNLLLTMRLMSVG